MSFFRYNTVVSGNGKVHRYLRLVEHHRQNGRATQRTVCDLGNVLRLPDFLRKLALFIGPANFLRMAFAEAELRRLGVNVAELPEDPATGSTAAVAAGPSSQEPGPADRADVAGDGNGDAEPSPVDSSQLEHSAESDG